MAKPEMPVPHGLRVWLVEQDLTRLFGEAYLTEAMILARTEQEALEAAASLSDPVEGFGLVAQRRLRAVDYGPAPDPLPVVFPRHRHGDALVLVVGTGADDGPPADSDVDEI